MQNPSHRSILRKVLFVIAFCLTILQAHGQVSCCPQSSLIVNTGYNPAGGFAIGITTIDPHWKTDNISAVMQADILTTTPAISYTLPNTYAIGAFAAWYSTSPPLGSDCIWISCINATAFTNDLVAHGSVPDSRNWRVYREFEICTPNSCETVDFNLTFAGDNYIKRAYVDVVANTFYTQTAGPAANYNALNGATYSKCLTAGTHRIYVEIYEDNVPFPGGNPAGLLVRGTISSPTGADIFRSEATGCAGWPYFCTIAPIRGSHEWCVGDSRTLSDAVTGGTWTSSDAGIATIDPSSGVSTGVSGGPVTITYTDPCGRLATYAVTVHALPTLASGSLTLCRGETTTLVATPSGGVWSGGGGHASITISGLVNAVSAGTDPVTYTDGFGCKSIFTVTVNPRADITGPTFSVCIGTPAYVSDPVVGGTWSSSSPGTGTIDPATGLITGISPGTTTITYSLSTGCTVTRLVTVNPIPVLTGMTPICPLTTFLVDHSPWTGGTWGISPAGIASVTTYSSTEGIVTGITEGSATITYVATTGCVGTASVSILHGPPPIGPSADICVGVSKTLTDTEAGGTWSSGDITIGSIESTSGIYTGVDTGTVIITYTLPNGCFDTILSKVSTVVPISGLTICPGQTTKFYGSPTPGTWSISGTKATIVPTTGDATGITTGTASITYTTSAGCRTITTLTIHPTPAPITGDMDICLGDFTTLSDATIGGTWRSGTPGLVSIDPVTGVAEGKVVGTSVISYESPLHCLIMDTMTVNPNPSSIIADAILCLHVGLAVSDGTPGGSWSTSDSSVVSIMTVGFMYGVSAGTATITYMLPTGCYTTKLITVINPPVAISGPSIVCLGETITLSDASGGGTWSTSATIVTVGSTSGDVTAGPLITGTATITYTTARFCTVTKVVTVSSLPSILSDTLFLCGIGSTTTWFGSPGGGTWSSSTTSVATIDAFGHITSVGYGTSTMTYTLPTGCYSTRLMTVSPFPDPISGTLIVCVGDSTTLSDATPGGSWYSLDLAIATVDIATGKVRGVSPGTTTITYYMPTTCYVLVTVTVLPLPAVITGPSTVCEGLTIMLSDATPGGTWSSSTTSIATVGSSTGIVYGVLVGSTTITYTAGSCPATKTIIVLKSPIFDKTPFDMCVDAAPIFMAGYPTGGTYSSGSTTVATVDPGTGFVSGVSAGTATITYSLAGCYVTMTITVDPLPAPISGTLSVCEGLTQGLSDVDAGGGWSSSDTHIAVINSSTGIYTGMNEGSCVVTYTLPTGCITTTTITVHPNPVITGAATVCETMTIELSTDITGGTWSGGSISTATVDPTTGVVTGIGTGTTTITYLTPAGCATSVVVTIIPIPTPIIGLDSACLSTISTSMSDATPGGIWSSSNTLIASIGSLSGTVTMHVAGSVVFTYTMPSGCYVTKLFMVQDVPVIPPVTGIPIVCPGSTTILMDIYAGGGTWSTSATTATVNTTTGVVTGVSHGTAVITFTATNNCGDNWAYKTVTVVPLEKPITGIRGICSGSTTTLSNEYGGGTWTSLNTGVATVDPVTGVVTGIIPGTATIQYDGISPCGVPFTVTMIVAVDMDPFITTNFLVACQTLMDLPLGDGYTMPSAGCALVCEGSVVRYYGNGVAGSVFTWYVAGGTIVTNYGDSIDVLWPTAGITGSVNLADTFSHCIGEAHNCIQVIPKPTADFSASGTSVCMGGSISFTDLSTCDPYSPIKDWRWDFGDGTYSSLPCPDHKFIIPNGSDTVTLVVRNSCGCTDTMRMVISISDATSPGILCTSAACDSELANYSTPPTCGTYNWSVIGGTIVAGAGTTSIRVRWDNVDTLGFGYVMLAEPCGPCPETTTVKIPVILKDAPIQGPSIACTDHMYFYSLPLWPATEYTWGAMGGPTIYMGNWVDYRPNFKFVTPGTYDLHARYQNEITLCGGNVFRTITVWQSTYIAGPRTVCETETITYLLADPTLTGSWTITDDTSAVVATGSGPSIAYAFPTPGRYMISVTGTLCADAIEIIVKPLPPVVATVAGSDIPICIGHTNSYVAGPDVTGSSYEWKVIGGRISPEMGNNTVNVKWDSVNYKEIAVRRFNKGVPFCEGPWLTIPIYEDTVKPKITGDTSACANGYFDYDSHYTTGDTYDWTVYPNTTGSITAGAHSPVVTVLWSDVTAITTATVVLVAHKCDSVGSDTIVVNIHPGHEVALIPFTTPSCGSDPVSIYATTGDSLYLWSFGDGATSTTSLNVAVHYFPPPWIAGMTYTTKVTVIQHKKGGCDAYGSASVSVPIYPGPTAFATYSDYFCTGIGSLLVATLTNNIGITVGWYKQGGYPVGSGDTLAPPDSGTYYYLAADTNGCITRSNDIWVDSFTCHSGGDTSESPCINPKTSVSCNTITLTGDILVPGPGVITQWYAYMLPSNGPVGSLNTEVVTYDLPGIYGFGYEAYTIGSGGEKVYFDCDQVSMIKDTIGIIPDYHYTVKCGTGGYDTIFLNDRSLYLTFDTITTITWEDVTSPGSPITIGTGANTWYRVLASAGPYIIRETVDGTKPPDETGNTFSCTATKTIAVPNSAITPTFTASSSSICTGLPIRFTPTFADAATDYVWDMGDGTTSLLREPERSYDYTGMGLYYTFTVTLTVKDSIGCPGSFSDTVNIHPNWLAGMMDAGGTMCPDAVPFALGYTATGASIPVSYTWSTGATTTVPTLPTSVSGDYFLYAVDAHGCRMNAANYESVIVIPTPEAEITGDMEYCEGELVRLSGNVGDDVLYRWFRNDTLIDSTKMLVDGILPAGNYGYKLVIGLFDSVSSIFCWDTSTIDTVRIHPLPPKPVILPPALLDPPSYHIQLTATEPNPGLFNWSNGTIGAVQDIYTGGQYKVWFTDLYGCINSDTVKVPMAPETYFPYFPVGCYNICSQQLPITLRARPDEDFAYHAWLMNGGVVQWGTNMHIQPYDVAAAGDYQWAIGNGLCTQTSGTMSVALTNCSCVAPLHVAGIIFTASVVCNPATPISYDITIQIASPMAGTTYKLGTDRGPIAPFSGVLPTGGWQPPMTLTYTYVGATGSIIVGDSVVVELELTEPGGSKCFSKLKVPLPLCPWVPFYKPGREDTTTKVDIPGSKPMIGSALLVFPNPSSGHVTVSYDYGMDRYSTRGLVIYDELGRELLRTAAPDIHGNWSVDAAGWAPGMYMIRMEADGNALQTGKIMITH